MLTDDTVLHLYTGKEFKQMRKLIPVMFSVLLLTGLPGCDGGSGPAAPGTPSPGGLDLDDEYGGLTMYDEYPAFGEPELFDDEVLAEDLEYLDEYEDDPEVSGIRYRHGTRFYTLRINWGRLMRAGSEDGGGCRDQEIAYGWNGSLSVERGAILLKKTILFESGDYIHERTDRRLLEWDSVTGPSFDGVLVQIVDPPAPPSGGTANEVIPPDHLPNKVTFKTPLYTRTFTIDELVRISEMIPIDRCGVAVSFNGALVPNRPCPRGFLAGIWKPVDPDTVPEPPGPPDSLYAALDDSTRDGREIRGHFYGNWIQANGTLAGHLRGVYGVNSDGRQVFFGKYIDLSGRFRGILRGTYGSMSMAIYADTAGYFRGEWINRRGTATGHLDGHWVSHPSWERGMFHGRWWTDCPYEPQDPGVASLN
jgi:hypothetical protein